MILPVYFEAIIMNERDLVSIMDIVPPSTPVELNAGLNTEIALTLLLLIAAILVLFIRSSQWRLWQLNALNRKNKISKKLIASHLIKTLRNKLNVARISPFIIPGDLDATQQAAWQIFSKQLQAARYSVGESSREDMEKLIQRARQWI